MFMILVIVTVFCNRLCEYSWFVLHTIFKSTHNFLRFLLFCETFVSGKVEILLKYLKVCRLLFVCIILTDGQFILNCYLKKVYSNKTLCTLLHIYLQLV